MDWQPILVAVKSAWALATGLDIKDVQLETEKGGFSASRGARVRLDFDELDLTIPESTFLEIDDSVVQAIVTQRELGITTRIFADDHRTPSQMGAWAHALASRLVSRIQLADAIALLEPVGLVFVRADAITPDPRQVIDQRQMSVASVRIAYRYGACELATEAPGDSTNTTDFFDRAEANAKRPRAVGISALDGVADWRYLWAGELTDMEGGRIVALGGDAAVYVVADPFDRVWSIGTGTITISEDFDVGQLLEGQAIVIVMRVPEPASTISIAGRIAGGLGWALEGLSDGTARLSALGSGGETTASVAGVLDDTQRVVVLHNDGTDLAIYTSAGSDTVAILGSHLAGPASVVTGALREATAGVLMAILAETRTDDPDQLRQDVEDALEI